jgi:hypothetical protein
MRIAAIVLTLMVFSSSAFADCVTNARGRVVCNNGQVNNARTGNASRTSETNQAGVTTTQTSAGGEAKTKNGKGVYKSPSGKNCYKTARSQGCN